MSKCKALIFMLLFCFGSLALYGQFTPIKAEIEPGRTTVKNHEKVLMSTTLRNTGSEVRILEVWSCGYSYEWTTNNPNVRTWGEACMKNISSKIFLKPGEEFKSAVSVRVDIVPGSGKSESVTFRMAFKDPPYGTTLKTQSNWSNAVTVNVTR